MQYHFRYYILSFSLFLLNICCSFAQQKKNALPTFADGVYVDFKAFKENQPNFPLYEIPEFGYKTDGEANLLFLKQVSLDRLDSSKIKSIDKVWGLCINGTPYIKIEQIEKDSALYFVRLYLIGSISYFYYPSIIDKEIEMEVYSPFTGNLVAMKTIVNKERTLIKKMLRYASGEVAAYSPSNFKNWIKNDPRLLKTVEDLSEEALEEKLFKTLKIYNDRHPAFQ